MPFSLPKLFRAIIMMVLAAHVFYMYSIARTINETVGLSLGTILTAALFGLIMLIPFVWAIALPEFPEMYLRHVRAKRWYEQGRCPDCGYPTTATRADRCPECGVALVSPRPYAVSLRTVRLFILINLLAWTIGCICAESWALVDEHRFRIEAAEYMKTDGHALYHRPRWWPSQIGELMYTEDHGVMAYD